MPSIRIVLTGPGSNGPSSSLRFNAALSDDVLLQNLAAALSLSNVDQLDTVRLTSLGYGHSHAAMGEVLRCLMSGVEEGPELGLKVVAGVVHFDWAVKRAAAASQQVQLRHPRAYAACNPAAASHQVQLGHPTAPAACAPAAATNLTPDSQCSGRAKGSGRKQPWHSFAKEEMGLLPRVIEDGEVGGREVKKGQFVQIGQKGLEKAQSELVRAAVLCASKRTLRAYLHHREHDKATSVQTLDKIMKRFKRIMRDENLRLAGKAFILDKHGQRQAQKPAKWVLLQKEEFLSASTGPHVLIRKEFLAGTFSPGLKAMFEQRSRLECDCKACW